MSNIIKIKRGSSVPSGSDLEHYELGYRTGTTELYINDGDTYRQLGGGATTSGSNNQLLTDDGSGGITSEGSLTFDGTDLKLLGDDKEMRWGAGQDFKVYVNSDNAYLVNATENKDIRFMVNDDNGTNGANITALKIDASVVGSVHLPNDNQHLYIGASGDLDLYHNGHSIIKNNTGQIIMMNTALDQNIRFQVNDGGNTQTVMELRAADKAVLLPYDSQALYIGESGDLKLTHNGSHSYIQAYGTGNLYIDQTNDDSDIVFRSDDGSGGVKTYFFLDGSAGNINFQNNALVALGGIYGNGGNITLYNDTYNFKSATSTDLMKLTTTGLGIGTTSPAGALHVVAANLSNSIRASNTTSDATTKYGTYLGSHYTNSEEPVAGMLITSGSASATGNLVTIGGGVSAANAANTIRFFTAPNKTTLTGTEKMRIDNSGKVGIGTDSPAQKLHIYDTSSSAMIHLQTTADANAQIRHQNDNISVYTGVSSADQYVWYHSSLGANAGFIPTSGVLYWNKNILLNNNNTALVGRATDGNTRNTIKIDSSNNVLVGDANLSGVTATYSSSRMFIYTDAGNVEIGPQNSSWNHIYTDRQGHLFDSNLTALDGKFQSYSGVDVSLRRSQGDTDRLLIQSGISTLSNQLHVEKGLSIDPKTHHENGDGRFHLNVLQHRDNANRTGSIIIDTDISRTSNRMSVIHVHGYGYGQHTVIDFKVCFYPYSGSNGPDGNSGSVIAYSLTDNGSDGKPKFLGINSSGNVAIALDDYDGAAKYFYNFQVDFYNGTSPVQLPTWDVSYSTTDGFGWIQKHTLLPPLHSTRIGANDYTTKVNGHLVLPYGEINDSGTDLNIVGTNAVTLGTESGTAITIPNASTNVGIGVSSPTEELDVNGVGKFRGNSQSSDVLELGQTTDNTYTQLYTFSTHDNAGGIRNVGDHLQIQSVRWGQEITFARNGQGGAVPTARFYNSSSNGYMELYKSTNPTSDATYTTEVHLDVNGNSYLNGGNVGIGTNSPSVKTHIKDASNDLYLRLETDKTNGNAQVQYFNDAQQYNLGINNADKFSLWDNTASATRFDIATDGDFKFYGTGSNFESVLSGGVTYLLLSGTATQRIEFRNTSTNANGWHGIPSWNTDAWHFYGPTSNGNELAYIYESSAHHYYRAFVVNNAGEDYDFTVRGLNDDNLIRTDAANDRVGIGTNSPDAFLDVHRDNNNSGNQFRVADTEGGTAAVRTYSTSDGTGLIINHYYAVGGSPYMRYTDFVSSMGDGAATSMRFFTKPASANPAEAFRIDNTQNAHFDKDVIAFSTTPSDIRLKENFEKIENGLEVITQLEGNTFNWKKDNERLSAGFKAQEVEKILPHLVDEKKLPLKSDDDKEYKTLRYEEIIPYLVEAIKEQQQQINKLEEKLNG